LGAGATDPHPGDAEVGLMLAARTNTKLAASALAAFCRKHGDRNLIKAAAYAHKVFTTPRTIITMQQQPGQHCRSSVTWEGFDTERARMLVMFVAAVQLPLADRPQQLEVGGTVWEWADRADPQPFWAAYQCSDAVVLAFRSMDGSVDDARQHPCSPAHCYVQGLEESQLPVLPIELVKELSGTLELSLVGYSHGALTALATTLICGADHRAAVMECVLFNCCTMFWPLWFSQLLPEAWWQTEPKDIPGTDKVVSWVISNDPLSEAGPRPPGGRATRAPQTPGATYVLPACSTTGLIDNHSFAQFTAQRPPWIPSVELGLALMKAVDELDTGDSLERTWFELPDSPESLPPDS